MLDTRKSRMTPQEAGRLGGNKTAQKGTEYYKRIGRKGGRVTQKQRYEKVHESSM